MAVFHLRREVFTHGILSSDLLHLADANLLHLAQQISLTLLAHTSGSTAALKYTTWLSAAVELLRCSEHTAKIYFESFLGVHNKNVHKHGGPKLLLSADVGEFMLFLFIQRYRTAASHQSAMAFVQQHLHVILMLVRDPHKHVHDFSLPLSPHSAHSPRTPSSPSSSSSASAAVASNMNTALDAHEFNRLSFLFYAHNRTKENEEQLERLKENQKDSNSGNDIPVLKQEVVNLASLTPFYSGTSSATAASPTASGTSVPLTVVEEWLLAHLAHGSTAAAAVAAGGPVVHHGHLLYPPVVSVCEVSGWDGRAAVYGATEVQGGDLLVKQCRESALSVYTHSRYATVDDCHSSSINAGVVSGLLIVRNCSHLTLTVACRSIHISDCKHCTFFLFSASRPIVLGGNTESLTLAPYNTYYPSLSTDLSVTGLPTSVNCWSSPLLMSSGSGTTSSSLLHSPLRAGRSLSAGGSGGGGGSHFSYHHSHSGGMGAPPSPPPPSSPRRSTSPSPLLASLSPPAARDFRDPQSSPTSPFRRSANSTHPISPSATAAASSGNFSASTTFTSPTSATSPSSSSSFSSTTPIAHSAAAHTRGGRDRTRSLQPPERGRRPVHRMSDGHESDDSGSEYSTEDERRDEATTGSSGARSAERATGGYNGTFNRLHNRSASYSVGEVKKDAAGALSALKSHHAFFHSTADSHDHSPLHLSPASLSPPLNPMLHPPNVSTLSPLTVSAGHTSSLNSFFPLSPHSASSTLAQAVTLLPPDQFYLIPPLPSTTASAASFSVSATPHPSDSSTPAAASQPTAAATTSNPFTLPSLYTDALADRPHRAIHARQLIDSAALSSEEVRQLRSVLTAGFESWLRERFGGVAGIRQWVETAGGSGLGGEDGSGGGLGGVVQSMVSEQRVGGGTVHAAE